MSRLGRAQHAVQLGGLVAGPVAALLVALFAPSGIEGDARAVLALAAWLAIWWVTEAVPLAAASLLPLVVLPVASGLGFASVAAPYASGIVYLYMGGMMLGLALEKCGLHRRLALHLLTAVGARPRRLVGAFMLATGALSMWLSNSATTLMLAPIGLSVVRGLREQQGQRPGDADFGAAIMLGIAYAASIGGMATPIGTPTNLVMTGYVAEHYGLRVGVLEWMGQVLPMVLVLLPLAWAWLCFGALRVGGEEIPGGREVLRARLEELGPVSAAERRTAVVFLLVAAGWITRPALAGWLGLPGLEDATIALGGALALFLLPDGEGRGGRLMDWDTARGMPWDILLLLGGGLSLAAAISASGADAPLAAWLSGNSIPDGLLLMALLSALIVFSGELTSNVAAAAALMPVLAALCAARGLDPLPVFMVATLSASCGFMLPVATPPNAIAFASGCISMPQMLRAGLGLNLICIALITAWMGWRA